MLDSTSHATGSDREAAAFANAMDAITRIVGSAHVKRSADDLAAAGRATIPQPKMPAAVVYPGTADDVAAIMRIAREHQARALALQPRTELGIRFGDAVSVNTVVLHLERLDRIIEVNEELAYAVVEPGVTYRQLKRYLQQHHPALWCDCTDGPPDGSVIGNALDRGLGVTHYSDHFGSLCGLDAVLPDGELRPHRRRPGELQNLAYAQVGRRPVPRGHVQPIELRGRGQGRCLAHAAAGGILLIPVRPRATNPTCRRSSIPCAA